MKKRLFLSLLAAAGGGVYALSKLIKKEKNADDENRKAMVAYYEQQGYNVHVYNDNNDFMLFHYKKNEKRHVFYNHTSITYEAFHSKLQAYYFHFTNEFFFICKDAETQKKIEAFYFEWRASLDAETKKIYGDPIAYFEMVDALLQ